MRKRTKCLSAAALVFIMILGALIPAPHVAALANTMNYGMVRVNLTKFGGSTVSPSSIPFTIDGSYSINGDATKKLARGQGMTVTNQNGTLYLTINGKQLNMGNDFYLKRHTTSGYNGIRFQINSNNALYPGDVRFTVSGSAIRTISYPHMEEYLKGVVPYEMSNYYPLESLKAQAVAARTYATNKMMTRGRYDYDVVDSSNDQCYYGISNSGHEKCHTAVDQTQGAVMTYGGNMAQIYYSASNGGQTESVQNAWGTAFAYSVIKDDPYDLANTAAVSRSITFISEPKYGTMSDALLAMIKPQVQTVLKGKGINKTVNEIEILSINSMQLSTPQYAAPSRLYTMIETNVTYQANGVEAQSADISLNIFGAGGIESTFNLGIQSKNNELYYIDKVTNGFKVTARRFGHGVGMSQRGAQNMAENGKTYLDILTFYCPGTTRAVYSYNNHILSSIDGYPVFNPTGNDVIPTISPTPTPSATVTPAATAAPTATAAPDYYKTGDLCVNTSITALRERTSNSSAILHRIERGTEITIIKRVSDTWYQACLPNGKTGYVLALPLQYAGQSARIKYNISASGATLRATASNSGTAVETLQKGSAVTLISSGGAAWAHVFSDKGNVGYISTAQITQQTAGGTPTAVPTAAPQQGITAGTTVTINTGMTALRQYTSNSSAILKRLPYGTQLTALQDVNSSWIQARTSDNMTGYVLKNTLQTGSFENTGKTYIINVNVTALRASMSNSSAILERLTKGTKLTSLSNINGAWLQVRSASGKQGYVLVNTIYEQSAVTAAPTHAPQPTAAPQQQSGYSNDITNRGKVTLSSNSSVLNLRAQPSLTSSIVGRLQNNQVVDVYSSASGFVKIKHQNTTGYVAQQYIRILYPTATVTLSSGSLNMRFGTNTNSSVVYQLPNGAKIAVLNYGSSWSQVLAPNGKTGYVMTRYLRMD